MNVLLRPVSAESLDNLVATSTAPFITHETARAAQSLNSPAPGGFLIVSDEGSDFVDQPWPSASLYDYPPQEQWNAFQKLAQMLMHTPFNAEGIVTKSSLTPMVRSILAFIRSRIVPACGAISAPRCCY